MHGSGAVFAATGRGDAAAFNVDILCRQRRRDLFSPRTLGPSTWHPAAGPRLVPDRGIPRRGRGVDATEQICSLGGFPRRFFVQATEGTSFGIVPYICPEGLGGVCAVVGAWGNIGAVCWGMMFKFGYLGKFDKGYEAMGYIIIASAVFSVFMRIKGQNHMFGTLE